MTLLEENDQGADAVRRHQAEHRQIGPMRARAVRYPNQAWFELHLDGKHDEAIAARFSWECGLHQLRFNGPKAEMIDILKFWLNQISEGSYE